MTHAVQAVSVEFQNEAIIPVEAVWDYVDNIDAGERGYFQPTKIHWADGSWSFGKGWWNQDDLRLVEVGAGAYGNMRILIRD